MSGFYGQQSRLSVSCMKMKTQVLLLTGFTALESVNEAESSGVCMQLACVELKHNRVDMRVAKTQTIFSPALRRLSGYWLPLGLY